MSTAKQIILENRLGQKVRSFAVSSSAVNVVYLTDSRRIEAVADLKSLDDNEVSYELIKKVAIEDITTKGVALTGLGRLRLAGDEKIINSPIYSLPAEDDNERLMVLMKKTSAAHVAAVMLLMGASWITAKYFSKKEEPALVTIVLPEPEKAPEPPKVEKRKTVKMAEKKIKRTKMKVAEKAKKPVLKTKKYVTKTTKAKDISRVGALAALGGTKQGTKGFEGLDNNSLKAIRAAGTGKGGGGVGATGKGGIKGYMPGSGLIAGSAGSGSGKASSAGGYGTKGAGGGRAGYGKISLVGGTSAVSLPLDDEATVEGGLDRDQIIAVINKNKGQIIYCYEKGLQSQPHIGGRVAVDFVIGANGRITTARVAQSSLGSKTVEGCMLQKMKAWKFPRPVGNVNVDVLYPFELMRVSSR